MIDILKDYLTTYGDKCVTFFYVFIFFSDNNEFGEVKPTPVLKSNPQGELAFFLLKVLLS